MKTAVITGASRGIGKQVSLELAHKNYKVFLIARDVVALEATKSEIEKLGGTAEIVVLDLLDANGIKAAAEIIKRHAKHLDILANIAGMYHDDKRHFFDIAFEAYPDHAIIQNINASLVGHVLLTKHLVPILKPGSCVMNTSGTFDTGEIGVISDYLAKKSIELFSRQLSLELKDKNIRSNCVRLGFVYTESVHTFFPGLKPEDALDPKQVAHRIVTIAEDDGVNGETIEITT